MANSSGGEAVLDIRTESASFFADVDKAEKRALGLGSAFDRAKAFFEGFGRGVNQVGKDIEKATGTVESFGRKVGEIAAGFVTAQAVMGGARAVWDGITGAITESVKAAGDAEKAHAQVAAALRAQGTAIPSVVKAYQEYAEALQQTTIFQDDAIEGAEALLIQVGNVMPRDMKKALQATTELASGLGKELPEAALLVAKAAEGNITALKKAGIVIDETKAKQEGFGYVLDQITAKFGGQAAALAGTYQGRIAQLANTWNNVQESIGRVLTTNGTLVALIDEVNRGITTQTSELNQNKQAVNLVSDAILIAVRAVSLLARGIDVAQTGIEALVLGARRGAQAIGNLAIMALEFARISALSAGNFGAAAEATQMIGALQKAVTQLGERNAETKARADAFGNTLEEIAGKADALAQRLEQTRGKTIAVAEATGGSADAWDRETKAAEDTKAAVESVSLSLDEFEKENARAAAAVARDWAGPQTVMRDVAHLIMTNGALLSPRRIGDQLPTLVPAIKDTAHELGEAAEQAASLQHSLQQIFAGKFSAGFREMGAAIKDMLDPSKILNTALGGLLSQGIGALVGLAGKGLTSLFSKLFGVEEKEVNRTREAFVVAAGGLDALNQKAARAGVTLTQMLNAKTVKDYEAAIKDLNDALDFQKQAEQDLTDTIAKYHFSIEELGPALEKQNLDKQAQEIYHDWKVLAAAGIDISAIAREMGENINDFVQRAIKSGYEVPLAMKPILEEMIRLGELTDASGRKITSLDGSGIKFSMTMSEGFQALIQSVDRLTEAIRRALGISQDLASQWANMPAPPGPPSGDNTGDGSTPLAAGGVFRFQSPVRLTVGERGRETFAYASGANDSFARRIAEEIALKLPTPSGAHAGAVTVHAYLQVDKQTIAHATLDGVAAGGAAHSKMKTLVGRMV